MRGNRGIWPAIVVLAVLAALLGWWLSASRPINTVTSNSTSQTAAASSPTTTRLAAQGVAHGSVENARDVVSILASLPGASRFNELLVATGIAATISPNSVSKYTLFVPVNRAFDRLPLGTISGLSAEEQDRLARYAVVSGRALSLTSQSTGRMASLSGDDLNFSYQGGVPMVNSSKILAKYEGENGVVYLIDSVLLPPQR